MLTAFVSAVVLNGLVTLTVPGLPVRDAVALIAEQTGEDLRVRDDANLNTLVVDVESVELDELLARIAAATGTKWQTEGERRTLVTTDDLDAEHARNARKKRREAIALALDALPDSSKTLLPIEIEGLVARAEEIGKSLEVWIPDDTQRAVLASIRESRPSTRLARQVALSLGAERLAEVESGKTVFYSTRPQGKERALPREAADALRAFAKEHAVWRDAVRRSVSVYPVKNPEDPRFGMVEGGEPSVLIVEVSRPIDVARVHVLVRAADAQGNLLETGYLPISLFDRTVPASFDPDVAFAPPLRLREIQAFLTFSETFATRSGPVAVSRDLVELLRDPKGHEPIALGAGPLLVAMAKAVKRDLVACVPDAALEWYYRPQGAVPEQWTCNGALAEIAAKWQCTAEVEGGWLTVAPTLALDASERYFDRSSLQSLLRSQDRERFVSIDTARTYASGQRSSAAFRSYDWRVVTRLMTFSGNVADAHLIHWENEGPLRFLGALTDAELASARGGVRTSSLNAKARLALLEWLSSPTSVARWFRTEPEESGLSNVGLMSHRQIDSGADMLVRVTDSTEPMSFQLFAESKMPFADLLEWSGRVYEEAMEPKGGMKVQIGTLRRVTLRLEVVGVGFVSHSVEQADGPPGDKWVLPRELTPEQLQPFKAAYERSLGGAMRE